jgi:F420-dependent oxidoreductase-like protein
MRIGLTARGKTVDDIVAQAESMETDGFTSLWFASGTQGDPLVSLALAGRATTSLELGTAVLQTYPCHPLLQANRAASVVNAMGRSFTLGIGPSHHTLITDVYGIPYDRPGTNTEEYVSILTRLLRGEDVDLDGQEWSIHSAGRTTPPNHPVPVLVSALAPRMLRVAGELADGTVLWMAPARAIETQIAPRLRAAAAAACRPEPRIVAGLPVAINDDLGEARAAIAGAAAIYDNLPNYKRILDVGGYPGTAEAAIVGNTASVRRQLQALLDAGATDIWAGIFPVGDDPGASYRRTLNGLRELLG